MPQIGNKCPGLNEWYTFESAHCLTKCQKQCMPASVLAHIEHKTKIDYHQGQYISVTSLLGCLRNLYGTRTKNYFVEPPQNWYSLRGTLIHDILEDPTKSALKGPVIPDWITETVFEAPILHYKGKEWFVKGTIDVLRPLLGEIVDYKTIGDRGLSIIKNGAKDDHILQFNMYRYLVERGWPVGQQESYTPIKINKIKCFYMTMVRVVTTGALFSEETSYMVSIPEYHPNEVSREIVHKKDELVLKRGKRKATAKPEDYELSSKTKWRITYNVPEVPLMDLNEIEELMQEKTKILIDAFVDGVIPPMCDPEMREWRCDYCPLEIQQWCDQVNLESGVKRFEEEKVHIATA